jgi:hypothetical protein
MTGVYLACTIPGGKCFFEIGILARLAGKIAVSRIGDCKLAGPSPRS